MHSSAVGLSTQWCKLILPEKQEDKMSKWPRERFDNWVSESNFVTEEWVNKKKKNRRETEQTWSQRHEFIIHFNFLFVCLSSAETCQRILSPLCHGSSSSTSNSPSCKSSLLVWSLSLAVVCILLQPFIIAPCALSATIQIVFAARHYNSCLCCTKPLICLSTCKRLNL